MFTGIVKEIGTVETIERSRDGARLRIAASLGDGLVEGDSVSVEGVCLTATSADESGFAADAMNQTLRLTTLRELEPGARVNLEPALRAGEPLGGHIVQGHVDGIATVSRATDDGFARRLDLKLDEELRRYVVERGSVTLAGVSLTVAGLNPDGFAVGLIPETRERTTLGDTNVGGRVNVEVDVVARYVERLLQPFEGKGRG